MSVSICTLWRPFGTVQIGSHCYLTDKVYSLHGMYTSECEDSMRFVIRNLYVLFGVCSDGQICK